MELTLLTAQANQGGSIFSSLMLIPIMLVIMYFIVIRPQKAEEKKKQEMINSLKKGDKVVTTGGIHGKIVEFKNNNELVVLNLGKDNNVTFNANVISQQVK